MADSAWVPGLAAERSAEAPIHSATVRLTHWITAVVVFLLLLTGLEIVVSHPRFYWGETGNVNTTPLFSIHIPASRATVPTGYLYTLPDQNGWSRYLHFQSAWALGFTALIYGLYGIFAGHFRRKLIPARADLSWSSISAVLADHLRRSHSGAEAPYNVVQRIAYLAVIFVMFPMLIWTGLAMSPGFVAVFPFTAAALGGQQSARTIHFFLTIALVVFVLVHVAMVLISGFGSRMRAMIIGRIKEQA